MNSSVARPLLHMPYFEQLAETTSESPECRSVSAALVVLRLFDSWMTEGADRVSADAAGLQAVREAIAAMDARDVNRRLLSSIVDAMVIERNPRIVTVAPRLQAYARQLQYAANWPLAADVYRTVLAYATPTTDAETVIAANMQLGRCLRVLAEWDEALSCFAAASQVATMTDDMMSILRARIQEANVAIDRGNLPYAEELLDSTIERAEASGLSEVRATAIHDRGLVAHQRGKFEEAIVFQFDAYNNVRNQMARDRVLNDLGSSFAQLGVYSAARDAFLVVAATAHEQYLRWTAMINLLDIAVDEGREPTFEKYRRELEDVSLPPSLATYFYIYVAKGHRAFDHPLLAKVAITRAIELATMNKYGQALIEAEQSLDALENDEVRQRGALARANGATWSPAVMGIAHKLEQVRTLAGA
jgi:tetratricopeptide (TPR) repeat protein